MTRELAVEDAVTVAARAAGLAIGGAGVLASTVQPDDRLPQWTQRRKMAPWPHHIP
jgi:hypothetical protein